MLVAEHNVVSPRTAAIVALLMRTISGDKVFKFLLIEVQFRNKDLGIMVASLEMRKLLYTFKASPLACVS